MSAGDLVLHSYVPEVTLGVTPAAALTNINVVSSSLDGNISTTVSNQINPNRSESDLVRTEGTTGGDLGIEWSFGAYNDFVEGALGGDFTTAVAYTASTISAANADNSLNDSGSGFSTANILPGHWIKFTGFTGGSVGLNGVPCKVVSVTTSKIIVSGITLVDDAAGESVTIKGSSVRSGTTKKSFSIEKRFVDLTNVFVSHKGCVVNGMNLNAAVGSIVNGSFSFTGTTTAYAATTIGTGPNVAATANQVFDPTDSLGVIYIDGTASSACIRSLNLTTTNNNRNTQCLGSLFPSNINMGTLGVTGTAELYFSDYTLLDKFLAGTAISLSYSFSDADGNWMVIDMPNVKFNTGTLSGISKNSDVMTSLSFTALYDSTAGYVIQVSSLPA